MAVHRLKRCRPTILNLYVFAGDIGVGDCAGSVDNGKLVGVKKGEYGNVECDEGFKLTGSYYVFCNYEGRCSRIVFQIIVPWRHFLVLFLTI